MTFKSIGLLSMAITCVAAVSFSFSSCDNNSNAPTTPGNGGVDRGKSPEAMGTGAVAVGSLTTGQGGASASYDDAGNLSLRGLTGADGNGVATTFDKDINSYRATVDVTFPDDGGNVYYEARDANRNTEARVDFATTDQGYEVYPTFTSHADRGEGRPQYSVKIYNNGVAVNNPVVLNGGDKVTIVTDGSCDPKLKKLGWGATAVNFQCYFTLGFDPCCVYTFQFPDGTQFTGNLIEFNELNTNGVYVYIKTSSIFTGGTVSTASVASATAFTK